jgi:hypothetical protein
MVGEAVKAQQVYEGFLALWKDADARLPVLVEAKRRFETPRHSKSQAEMTTGGAKHQRRP